MIINMTIEQVERELLKVLYADKRVVPSVLYELIVSGKTYEFSKSVSEWCEEVVPKIIDCAKPLEGDSVGRALCPLCGSGINHQTCIANLQGYTLPIGMRRHLLGAGKANQCPVMEIAVELRHKCLRDYTQQTY